MRLAILFLLSGCSLIIGGESSPDEPMAPDAGQLVNDDGSPILPDGALLPVDSGPPIDSGPPAECDRFLDIGCNLDETCKDGGQCVLPSGDSGLFSFCDVSSDCDRGLGCWTGNCASRCLVYCDDNHQCSGGGECTDGYCNVVCFDF